MESIISNATEIETVVTETEAQGVETINVSATPGVDNGTEGTIDTTNLANAREVIKDIPFNKLVVDISRNPRKAAQYGSKGAAADKARSLHKHGLKEALTVSERPDGTYHLLRGFLRYHGMKMLRESGLEAVGKGDVYPAIPADPKVFDKVRCRVFRNLDLKEEMDLLMDHRDSVPLDKSELLDATMKMVRQGFTEEYIQEKLGFASRGPASILVRLCRLPKYVRDAYTAYADDPKSEGAVKLTDSAINALYSAYGEDKKSDPIGAVKGTTPKTDDKWAEIVSKGSPARTKTVSAADLTTMAEAIDDIDIKELLLAIAAGNKQEAGTAIERLSNRLS